MDAAGKLFGAEAIMVAVTGCLLEALDGMVGGMAGVWTARHVLGLKDLARSLGC